MLEGVQANARIIAGAYVDGHGGVCPMLAAHRRGARTNFLSFARAWDRFARAGRRARSATERELGILVRQLQSSLLGEEQCDLDRALAEHRQLVWRRQSAQADPTGTIRAARLRVSSSRPARPGGGPRSRSHAVLDRPQKQADSLAPRRQRALACCDFP